MLWGNYFIYSLETSIRTVSSFFRVMLFQIFFKYRSSLLNAKCQKPCIIFQHLGFLPPGVPACNGPETIPGFAQNSLDVMFSRQLFKEGTVGEWFRGSGLAMVGLWNPFTGTDGWYYTHIIPIYLTFQLDLTVSWVYWCWMLRMEIKSQVNNVSWVNEVFPNSTDGWFLILLDTKFDKMKSQCHSVRLTPPLPRNLVVDRYVCPFCAQMLTSAARPSRSHNFKTLSLNDASMVISRMYFHVHWKKNGEHETQLRSWSSFEMSKLNIK